MKILIIEDSSRLQDALFTALRKSGYAVDQATDGEEGCWMAESESYDAIILDLMLPGLDGISLLQKLRKKNINTHILILTAKDTVLDRVEGLNAGADDYLTKPFSIDELLARVAALIRRSYGTKNPEITLGNLMVDSAKREVMVDDRPLALAPREYKLMHYLVCRAGILVTREEIESHLYEEASERFSNVIDSTVSILRKNLADCGCTLQIRTRRGFGYILETPEP